MHFLLAISWEWEVVFLRTIANTWVILIKLIVIFNDSWESILIFFLDHMSYRWSLWWIGIEISNGWCHFGEIVTLVVCLFFFLIRGLFDFITCLQLHCALAALWCWRPITYSCNSSDTHSTNKLQVFLKVNCCFCSSICVCQLINVFNYLMWCYIWFLALLFFVYLSLTKFLSDVCQTPCFP